MKAPIEYRCYVIAFDDGWYIAKSLDSEPCEIGSRHLFRVMRAIDALWQSLETLERPQWFSTEDFIDLDAPVADRLKLFSSIKGVPSRIKSSIIEAMPSDVDPPPFLTVALTVLAAVGIATLVGIGMHQLISNSEPAIIFTLAVMAIALQFGTRPAIGASLLTMVLYNISFIDPVLTFTVPTAEEFSYTAINIVVSMILPWLLSPRWLTTNRKALESDHTPDTAVPYL